jgi:mortality factor 4-like protein 1
VHLNINRESAIQEVMAGLKEYFNVTLGSLLLYKFERMQYADVILFFFSKLKNMIPHIYIYLISQILKEHPDKPMSEIYGAPHLLRMFSKNIIFYPCCS